MSEVHAQRSFVVCLEDRNEISVTAVGLAADITSAMRRLDTLELIQKKSGSSVSL